MSYSIMQNTNEILQAYCRNMLIATDGLVYNEPYIFPDTVSTKSIPIKLANSGNSFFESSDFLRLYPNPADEYLTIEYKMPYNSHKIIVEILTIDGQNIEVFTLNGEWGEKIIDLRNYKLGTYLIRLWSEGRVLDSGKFIKM
ncbi:MAG: T9SS type A sorting domain-containing protein [Bacteroidales bacterium]|nr:T9SS type A sorting domain-containing protein [Bacteroidales bacterium]